MSDLKPTTIRDEGYLGYLRRQPCVACLDSAPSDPHHLEQGKIGGKGDDWTAVPLCRRCHRTYHDKGQDALETMHRVNLWKQAHRHLRRYLSQETELT